LQEGECCQGVVSHATRAKAPNTGHMNFSPAETRFHWREPSAVKADTQKYDISHDLSHNLSHDVSHSHIHIHNHTVAIDTTQ
jgi:hypothetical protein